MKEKLTVGFAFCGSFCTLSRAIEAMKRLAEDYDVIPIFSERMASTDTRFGKAEAITDTIVKIAKHTPITTITEAETVGPQKLFDLLVIAPCTGNTLAKLANGIIDSTVPMAAKAHLRNERPLLLALASNDALSTGLLNVATLTVRKHCYFVPLSQDDPWQKPFSLVAHFDLIPEAAKAALAGKQLQPMLLSPPVQRT
ncbi:MAG: dipicolinate synthase subunit B [Clostridia bacterium]|nr:dipicolinate synthase subunit B [Clostridia bacterium]